MTTSQDVLAALLGEVATPGAFSARRTAPVDDFELDVRGVGRVLLPVSAEQANQLCRVGRPATYGLGDKTLLDARVRNTWEIPISRVKLNQRRWAKALVPALDCLRADLGLPPGCRLKAELHSMLVYGAGQFFVPHQDSEKADAMVGSLVVTLPSSFKGGALVVRHAGMSATYRSPKKSLSLVAFYADCRHEVRPVTSGYRVTLTYNPLLQGDAATVDPPPAQVDPVAAWLLGHFETAAAPARRTAGAAAHEPARRLVYLLDHEYTARGLSWSRLKGPDAMRAATLQAAAVQAGCEVVLALADIHETWDCMEQEESPWYGGSEPRRWDDWDDELDEDDPRAGGQSLGDQDRYQLEDLIDWDVTLVCWIDAPDGEPKPVSLSIDPSDVCASVPSVELPPYASEYEGYMGNYGNTMDRWYHRAALVVWPQHQAFAARAEASPLWALGTLSARLGAGGAAEAQELTATLAPFWPRVARGETARGFFGKALRIARDLDEPDSAAMLVTPLRVEMLGRREAPALAALAGRYGEGWARDLLQRWFAAERLWAPASPKGPDRTEWVSSLLGLCEVLLRSGGPGVSAASLLIRESWAWLRESVVRALAAAPPSRREEELSQLGRPIAAVLLSAALIAAPELTEEALHFLCPGNDDLIGCLMEVLRSARALAPSGSSGATGPVEDYCRRRLSARLARPPRAEDDWSVEFPAGCSCELCARLEEFLGDPARRSFDWPLATERRRHVHARIDNAELPVRHETRRSGRPYTLVLTKTEALFERDRQARLGAEADLAWLNGPGLP